MMICVECGRYRELPEGKGKTEVYHMEMSDREYSTVEEDMGGGWWEATGTTVHRQPPP
jgi:hypothetical protein